MSESQGRQRRPRIVDVARTAGVSAQTVSNVINGRGGFTEPTRERVEAAIATLGFQPNRYAQSLRSQRTGLVGFDMVSDQLDGTNPFTVSLLGALIRAAEHHGQRILVFTHGSDQPADFRATATSGLVDGLVLSDSAVGDPRVGILDEVGLPFVVFGRTDNDADHTWLDIDNRAAMRQPVDLLVGQGCRDVAYVSYSGSQHWTRDRRRGTREALAAHGLSLPRDRVLIGPSLDALRPRLVQLLDSPHRPDAIVTASDPIGVLTIGIATSLGLRVGHDIAVTGFDAGPLSTMVSPALTSVSIPVNPIAERLLTLLGDRIEGAVPYISEVAETALLVRESSGFTPPAQP